MLYIDALGLLQRRTQPRICRDGMGPRNPTDSVRKQSRPAPLTLCSLLVCWFPLGNSLVDALELLTYTFCDQSLLHKRLLESGATAAPTSKGFTSVSDL